MKKHILGAYLSITIAGVAVADTIPVTDFVYHGSYPLAKQITVGADTNAILLKSDWTTILPSNRALRTGKTLKITDGKVMAGGRETKLHSVSFPLQAKRYAKARLKVDGTDNYKITVNGRDADENLTLEPATYNVTVNFLTEENKIDTVSFSLISDRSEFISLRADGKRNFTINDVIFGTSVGGVEISPDGKWLITNYTLTTPTKDSRSWQTLENLTTGQVTVLNGVRNRWMPRSTKYYHEQNGMDGTDIIAIDPATGQSETIAENIPSGRYYFSPDEKSLFYTVNKPGPKEDRDIYRILEPEDRQPGWRDRQHIALYDLATGVYQPVTDGHLSARLMDISDDGSKLLVSVGRSRLEKRPTTVFDVLVLDQTNQTVDTIVSGDGFVGLAVFSPDAKQILISGSPESLGGIGKNVPEGRIPSSVDTQLYLYDVDSRKFTPLTREFNPNVGMFRWNRADGMIYFTAENKDLVSFFRLDPKTGKITCLPVPEENIGSFSLPLAGTSIVLKGQSASNPDRVYAYDSKTLKWRKIAEPKEKQLSDVKLGDCNEWTFVNSRGDSINGRFYLPPDFDPSKKYPLIVNYYGGCSPTERQFESRYPHNAYAALGYVVYVINPSGATGFGQEFSSRHVNTAGKGVAEDIIEGTKLFCETHPYVDSTKIGCIGASYGGFMTQYLQTVTDLFAAAISHAGISDHTSYWGNGYWGYSYSEVSMADSYPWSDRELYVDQSPLYNADKIHTPILFLHGDSDHNVPFAESVQLFTALKLLGRPTELVAVSDQDHHILDIDKRLKWQNTIWAWFAKYLQDDPTWWDALYPPVNL